MPEPEKEEPKTVSLEEHGKLKQQTEDLKRKNDEYEKLLLDPGYADYLANKGRKEPEPKKSAEEEEAEWEGLSQKQVAEKITSMVVERVKETIGPLKEDIKVKEAMADIKEVSAKHPDFWDHKDEMFRIAKQHPTLGAEQVYQLATAGVSKKPAREPARSELPGNMPKGDRPAPKGFKGKFDQAWKDSGLDN